MCRGVFNIMKETKSKIIKSYAVYLPNILIVNDKSKNISVSNYTVYLYIMLKIMGQKNAEVNRRYDTILNTLGWDIRTFKKHLTILKDQKCVDFDENQLKCILKHHIIHIKFLKVDGGFTQVDKDTIERIISVFKCVEIPEYVEKEKILKLCDRKEMALRFFFYLECMYNKECGYSYPTQDQIKNAIGISKNDIVTLSKMMESNNLMVVKHGVKYYNKKANRVLNLNNTYVPILIR